MRYSANLNIIIKAIEKASSRLPRDFMELENLQNNPLSASKFSSACYNKIKQTLVEDLLKFRPEYNLIFSDGQEVINKKDAEYCYTIFPVDGIANLSRANPHFAVAIALEHISPQGQKESISVAINNIVGNELYYCEKGFGAYVSNRRIRVSKRSNNETFIVAVDNLDLVKKEASKNLVLQNYGCKTLEIAYLASSKIDSVIIQNHKLLKPFTLLAREAGAKIVESEKNIFAGNGLIDLM
ncbi:MAG: hypothetical protein FJ368_04555 [Pelagibacterales bacterium]|nr:hypothetical protein [Pelagibacterales bacterium]